MFVCRRLKLGRFDQHSGEHLTAEESPTEYLQVPVPGSCPTNSIGLKNWTIMAENRFHYVTYTNMSSEWLPGIGINKNEVESPI
jgi:hypothetical protein